MIIMNLKQLQNLCRGDWDTYIAKHFTKQTCEDCGNKESLHLHHVRTFKEIFDFGCNLFGFNDETTISQETEQIFRSWMLGEQLKSPMKTLCSDCHLKAHGKTKKENKKLAEESKRKAKVFDKIYKLLYSKFTCETNYKDIYGGGKNGPIKVGQWLEGCMLKQPKLTDKETIKLLNLLLMGMGSDYYVQLNGYIGLDDKDDGKRSL